MVEYEMKKIVIYDTTLRDGAQAEEISFSVEDKLLIAAKLDEFGVDYIEGGYPGANPRDAEFFRKAASLSLQNATLVAFGATHHPDRKPEKDRSVTSLLESGAPAATVFGKTWDFHVKHALKVTNKRNLALIHDTVAYLKKRLATVFFDAEHFFDGYINNPEYAVKCLLAAQDAGADALVLCDTNGGVLPHEIEKITRAVKKQTTAPLGIHAHNDSDCAVASSILAVKAGAVHVQGTMNGLGERTGNANLCSIIPGLQLKLGRRCVTDEQLAKLRDVSRYISEIANVTHFRRQPFVGDSAFAHKAGMHVSAIVKHSETYEHIKPELVGNAQRVLVSDLSGKSNIVRKAREFGIKLDASSPKVQDIVAELKTMESQGFTFEGAEASFELLMKKALGLYRSFFELRGFRVLISKRSAKDTSYHESTVRLRVDGREVHTAGAGNGPVNALDQALRKALLEFYPTLADVKLLDYKVRVLSSARGTAANVRVLIESTDGHNKWSTVGVSEDVVEASYQALVDSYEYKLLKEEAAQ
jgi:2-isopropylmalate synthase